MLYIGIDPGWSGSIAVLDDHKRQEAHALKDLTLHEIYKILDELSNEGDCMAVLELVHSMPKQGVASSFKFGQCYGMLEMALACCRIPYTLYTPQSWQKVLKCRSGGDKKVTRARAQQLYPRWPKAITHATADGILIATFCRQIAKHIPSLPAKRTRKRK